MKRRQNYWTKKVIEQGRSQKELGKELLGCSVITSNARRREEWMVQWKEVINGYAEQKRKKKRWGGEDVQM
jgi:hypothetical protein